MGFIDRVIHHLGDENLESYDGNDLIKQIKRNIGFVLNTNAGDCVGLDKVGLLKLSQETLEMNTIAQSLGKEICEIIAQYEKRIQILSMSYDDALMPWGLQFSLTCCLTSDRFNEFVLYIDFYSNRYCEVK